MTRYVLAFSLVYLVLTVISGGLAHVFEIDGGLGVNIAVTIAASFGAAWHFVQQTGRQPMPKEARTFALAALASALLISLLLVIVVGAFMFSAEDARALLDVASSLSFLGWALVSMVVICAAYFLALWWSFSWYAKFLVRKAATAT